jgi:dimethylargininase
MLVALTRSVPESIARCELTHLAREPVDHFRAVEQHTAYEQALRRLGCRVERLPDRPEHPDSVFVEDAAVVFDGIAVVARPGAESRRDEVPSVATALRAYRDLAFIEAPGTLDGGDVLVVGRRVYVGASGRTNPDAARQLATLLAPCDYTVVTVQVRGCLHLKSGVTLAGDDTLILNPDWVDRTAFAGAQVIDVDQSEPMAANVLRVGDVTLCASAYPRTRARLEARGIRTEALDTTEVAKAEGALTCCSLIFSSNEESGRPE